MSARRMRDGSGEPLESSLLARIDRKCIAARNPIDGYPQTDSTSERRQPNVPCSIAVRIRAIRSRVHATLCTLSRRAAVGSPTWNRWRR